MNELITDCFYCKEPSFVSGFPVSCRCLLQVYSDWNLVYKKHVYNKKKQIQSTQVESGKAYLMSPPKLEPKPQTRRTVPRRKILSKGLRSRVMRRDRTWIADEGKGKYVHFCYLCGEIIHCEGQFTIDHVIPYREVREHKIENLKVAHKVCNLKKG